MIFGCPEKFCLHQLCTEFFSDKSNKEASNYESCSSQNCDFDVKNELVGFVEFERFKFNKKLDLIPMFYSAHQVVHR